MSITSKKNVSQKTGIYSIAVYIYILMEESFLFQSVDLLGWGRGSCMLWVGHHSG